MKTIWKAILKAADMDKLIAKLEAAKGPDQALNGEIFWFVERQRAETAYWNATVGKPAPLRELPTSGLGRRAIDVSAPQYLSSIDAALTLVPEGAHYQIAHSFTGDLDPVAHVALDKERIYSAEVKSTAAIALCIAALRARQALSEEGL